jgi:acetylornithine deacetylase/succinyl-diaminopimelate desuccinylase-like protein
MRAAAAPSDPPGSNAGNVRCEALGVPLFRMPSGAGHDAMKLHEVMPQAMLFVRGQNAGISHNPLESTTSDDMQLAVEAFQNLLDQLAKKAEPPDMNYHSALDAWIDAHFDEQVQFLQELIRVPTDTPPGNNAPHAERTADLLKAMGLTAEKHAVPLAEVQAAGLESITNLIVRRRYGDGGKTIALNAHGDVVPPGEGWTHDPYGGEIAGGKIFGRAAAVSKCDFSTFTFAVRALEAVCHAAQGGVELHFTYDEEFGGEVGPGWLLSKGLTKPDLMIAAGFSYQVVVAHNGCLQMEVTVHGEMSHAAIPDSGTDALQGATHILNALYALNADYKTSRPGSPASPTPT